MRFARVNTALMVTALVVAACGGAASDSRSSSDASEISAADSSDPPATETATTTTEPAVPASEPITDGTSAPIIDLTDEPATDPLIGPSELLAVVDDVVVVDVRSADAYASGHIEGAINLSADVFNAPSADGVIYQLADLETGAAVLSAAGIDADTNVVMYGDDQGIYAARGYFALKYWGHPNVQLLDGAFAGWVNGGNAVSTEVVALDRVDHPVAAEPGANRLLYDDVTAAQSGADAAFLDARAPDEYDGTTLFGDEAGGHIPGATNIEWSDTLDENGFFKPRDELRTLYADAGFLHDGPVITYCYIGVRASHSWFVLNELLGYPDVGMYDGSWVDYGTAPGADIET